MAKTKAKSTSVKKSIKSNKNKKFSLKNLDFKKNWKKLSYLGLAGFLALSSVGYGGWKLYEQESASAIAFTNWGSKTTAQRVGSSYIKMCRVNTLKQVTVVRFKMVKINSGYEKFSIVTNGEDYYWGTSISGQHAEGELNYVSVNSSFSVGISGPVNSGNGTNYVYSLTTC